MSLSACFSSPAFPGSPGCNWSLCYGCRNQVCSRLVSGQQNIHRAVTNGTACGRQTDQQAQNLDNGSKLPYSNTNCNSKKNLNRKDGAFAHEMMLRRHATPRQRYWMEI
jgi:hypothetical protein